MRFQQFENAFAMTPPKMIYAANWSTSHNALSNLSFESIILQDEKFSLDTFVAILVSEVSVFSVFSFVMPDTTAEGRGLIVAGSGWANPLTEKASKP